MNIKQVKTLAELLKQYNLSVIDIQDGEAKIRLESKDCVMETRSMQSVVCYPDPAQQAESVDDQGVDFKDMDDIRSPMIGVFYNAPSPNDEPFVKINQRVKKGDVLCIIEAMKLMNEITADYDCDIYDICVQNGQVVEYGQTIFKMIRVK